MDSPGDWLFGVDLGGTNVKAASLSRDGVLLEQVTRATEDGPDAPWVATVRDMLRESIEAYGRDPLAIGLAAPGLVSRDGRSIAWMQGRMSGLESLDWTEALESPTPVRVLNDGHAALLGEVWKGAAAGHDNVVLLTLGTGVGGAIMCDGHLLRGHLGRAGHLGHLCLDVDGAKDIAGTPGSLEDAIGDCTIHARSGGRFDSAEEVVRAHSAGDAEASKIWLASIHHLACGIATIINAVDPGIVVLGGGIAKAGAALFEPLADALESIEWRPFGAGVDVVPAQLEHWAGAYGAAHYALTYKEGS